MFEVQGKYNTAKIFTDVIDQNAISQVIELCKYPGSFLIITFMI